MPREESDEGDVAYGESWMNQDLFRKYWTLKGVRTYLEQDPSCRMIPAAGGGLGP